MFPTLYRRWTSLRLQQMEAWINEWSLERMYAGVPGRGAMDAAYKTAIADRT